MTFKSLFFKCLAVFLLAVMVSGGGAFALERRIENYTKSTGPQPPPFVFNEAGVTGSITLRCDGTGAPNTVGGWFVSAVSGTCPPAINVVYPSDEVDLEVIDCGHGLSPIAPGLPLNKNYCATDPSITGVTGDSMFKLEQGAQGFFVDTDKNVNATGAVMWLDRDDDPLIPFFDYGMMMPSSNQDYADFLSDEGRPDDVTAVPGCFPIKVDFCPSVVSALTCGPAEAADPAPMSMAEMAAFVPTELCAVGTPGPITDIGGGGTGPFGWNCLDGVGGSLPCSTGASDGCGPYDGANLSFEAGEGINDPNLCSGNTVPVNANWQFSGWTSIFQTIGYRWTCEAPDSTQYDCSANYVLPSDPPECGVLDGTSFTDAIGHFAYRNANPEEFCSPGLINAFTKISYIVNGQSKYKWVWGCAPETGSSSGTFAQCSAEFAETPVDGACGTVHGTSQSALSAGSWGMCSGGNVVDFTILPNGWTWVCAGAEGGTNSLECSATSTGLNGVCGPPHGQNFPTGTPPAANASLCSSGFLASGVSFSNNKATWVCAGDNPFLPTYCEAYETINGSCGPLNGQAQIPGGSISDSQWCSSGTRSPLDHGPSGDFTWTCLGKNGGSDSLLCNIGDIQPATCHPNGHGGTFGSLLGLENAGLCQRGYASAVVETANSFDWSCITTMSTEICSATKDTSCAAQPNLDLVWLQDLTGSFKNDVPNLLINIDTLVNHPVLAFWTLSLNSFQDFPETPPLLAGPPAFTHNFDKLLRSGSDGSSFQFFHSIVNTQNIIRNVINNVWDPKIDNGGGGSKTLGAQTADGRGGYAEASFKALDKMIEQYYYLARRLAGSAQRIYTKANKIGFVISTDATSLWADTLIQFSPYELDAGTTLNIFDTKRYMNPLDLVNNPGGDIVSFPMTSDNLDEAYPLGAPLIGGNQALGGVVSKKFILAQVPTVGAGYLDIPAYSFAKNEPGAPCHFVHDGDCYSWGDWPDRDGVALYGARAIVGMHPDMQTLANKITDAMFFIILVGVPDPGHYTRPQIMDFYLDFFAQTPAQAVAIALDDDSLPFTTKLIEGLQAITCVE